MLHDNWEEADCTNASDTRVFTFVLHSSTFRLLLLLNIMATVLFAPRKPQHPRTADYKRCYVVSCFGNVCPLVGHHATLAFVNSAHGVLHISSRETSV
jgi:hypothetical protein